MTTRQCSIEDLNQKYIPQIRKHLSRDDQVLACFEHKDLSLFSLLDGPALYFAEIITQNRIVKVGKILEEVSESMLLAEITGVEEALDSRHPGVAVLGSEDIMTFGFDKRDQAARFASILRQAIEQAGRTTRLSTDVSNNTEGRLRALIKLRDQGLIDSREFEVKRQEILGQL